MKKIIMFLAIVLLIPSAHALGIAPAQEELRFEPGAEGSLALKIINNNLRNMTTSISVDGELEEYFTPRQEYVALTYQDEEKTAIVDYSLPQDLEPGPHDVRIRAREEPGDDGGVSAIISVTSRITVFSPYPGKYLRGRIIKTFFEPGKRGNFIVEVDNAGSEDVTAKVSLDVKEKGNIVETLESQSESIQPQESVLFNLDWIPESPGRYMAEAIVEYDDEILELERGFEVGFHRLRLLDIEGDEFRMGEEVSFRLRLKNDWNQPLDEAYAEMEFVKDGNSYGGSPTEVTGFEPFEEKTLRAEWDSSGAEEGEYDLKVRLHYLGDTVENTYKATLTSQGLFIEGLNARILTPQSPPAWLSMVLILATIALSWIIVSYSRKEH